MTIRIIRVICGWLLTVGLSLGMVGCGEESEKPVTEEPSSKEKLERLLHNEILSIARSSKPTLTEKDLQEFEEMWKSQGKDVLMPKTDIEKILRTIENPTQKGIDIKIKQIKAKLKIAAASKLALPVPIQIVATKINQGKTPQYIQLFIADKLLDGVISAMSKALEKESK